MRNLRVPLTGGMIFLLALVVALALHVLTDELADENVAQAQTLPDVAIVPQNWSLIPVGLGPGDQFRLLFLSSTKSPITSTDIETYNTFIQGIADNGHADIQAYSSGFRVVGCTDGRRRPGQHQHQPGRPRRGCAHLLARRLGHRHL